MKAIGSLIKTFSNLFSKQFYFFASLASLAGFFVLILKDVQATYFAQFFFCLMLIVFTSYLLYTLTKVLEIKQSEYENHSTFVKYETLDGNMITYEAYKLIQAKKPILTELDYSFKWTGSHLPIISSDLQDVTNIVDENDATKYDRAILKFKKPIYYNQNCVIHFKAILDDTDKKSKPYVCSRVCTEIDIIH